MKNIWRCDEILCIWNIRPFIVEYSHAGCLDDPLTWLPSSGYSLPLSNCGVITANDDGENHESPMGKYIICRLLKSSFKGKFWSEVGQRLLNTENRIGSSLCSRNRQDIFVTIELTDKMQKLHKCFVQEGKLESRKLQKQWYALTVNHTCLLWSTDNFREMMRRRNWEISSTRVEGP